MKNLFGTLGAIFFAICAYPQVYQVWITGKTDDLSGLFLIFWALGEIFMWGYVFIENRESRRWQWPLHANYFMNSLSLVYLLFMKFFK